jgi:class 3 adenylate cyclase
MLNRLKRFAKVEGDSTELGFQKLLILFVASTCCLCGIVWSSLYLFVFGPGFIALLPILFTILVGSALVVAHITRQYKIAVYAQLFCITWITALIEWSIGSFDNSGFVVAWSFLGPIGALIFLSLRQSIIWMLMFVVILIVSVVFKPLLLGVDHAISEPIRIIFYIMNIGVASTVVFSASAWFATSIQIEKKRSEELLLNILPETVALELKDTGKVVPKNLDNVTVIFSDFQGFTALAETMDAAELVAEIDLCFSAFDKIISRHGIEKIKTIGDSYMAIGGGLISQECSACKVAIASLEMVEFMNERLRFLNAQNKSGFQMRIGIHTGKVVAGVVGLNKFQYDVWGDTVNFASRLEQNGEVGKVNISAETHGLIKDKFACTYRGRLPVKGKADAEMYFVNGILK